MALAETPVVASVFSHYPVTWPWERYKQIFIPLKKCYSTRSHIVVGYFLDWRAKKKSHLMSFYPLQNLKQSFFKVWQRKTPPSPMTFQLLRNPKQGYF